MLPAVLISAIARQHFALTQHAVKHSMVSSIQLETEGLQVLRNVFRMAEPRSDLHKGCQLVFPTNRETNQLLPACVR